MVPNIKEIGWMICKREMELKHGQMVQGMRDNTNKGRNKDKVVLIGLIDLVTKENF